MTAPVELEQAHRLRQAEIEWLHQCAARIRAAHAATQVSGVAKADER